MIKGPSIPTACGAVALAAAIMLAPPGFAALGPDPVMTIPLTPLGLPGQSPNRQMAGLALNSLHYVDQTHMLVAFTVHTLLERIPNDPESDEDRNVAAVLLELPSGKVLARTVWRLHDYGRFLWELGDGRFLLRVRNKLSVIVPMAHPGTAPFEQQLLVNVTDDLVITDVSISEDHGVLTLQTQPRSVFEALQSQRPSIASPQLSPEASVLVRFMRLFPPATPDGSMGLRLDSGMWRRGNAAFSMDSAGYIEIVKQKGYLWHFRYRKYTGEVLPAGGYETSCVPFTAFVSRSEFVSLGCRGSEAKPMMVGLNLKDEVMWQMNFTEAQRVTGLSIAAAAGRFAISRGLSADPFLAPENTGRITTQDIRVLQAYNGKPLLQVTVAPAQSTGENFALSPNGIQLAVLQDQAVKIYQLPALNSEDKKQVAAERALDPPVDPSVKVGFVTPAGQPGSRPPEELLLPVLPPVPPASGSLNAEGPQGPQGPPPADDPLHGNPPMETTPAGGPPKP